MSTYVKAHVRGREDQEQDQTLAAAIMVATLVASIIILVAVIFWQTTLVLFVAGLLTVAAHYRYQRYLDKLANGIIVNNMGKRRIV